MGIYGSSCVDTLSEGSDVSDCVGVDETTCWRQNTKLYSGKLSDDLSLDAKLGRTYVPHYTYTELKCLHVFHILSIHMPSMHTHTSLSGDTRQILRDSRIGGTMVFISMSKEFFPINIV